MLNHDYNENIKNIPINTATGSTCEISPSLRFYFCQPVYFNSDNSTFTSDSTEEIGRFVGIIENAGHAMEFSILKITNNKVISRSNVRPTVESTSHNPRIYPLTTPEFIKSWHLPSAHLEDNE